MAVPLWRVDGPYESADRAVVPGLAGPVDEISLAPPLLIARELAALRQAPAPADWPVAERLAWLRGAAAAFRGDLAGEPLAAYVRRVVQATGLPRFWVERAAAELSAGLAGAEAALQRLVPGGDLALLERPLLRLPGGGWRAWVPRGRTLAFIAPSNHPAVHLTWVLALALGYQVVVRPGREDPFTPHRLLLALQAAGLPPGLALCLPCDHGGVDRLLAGTDLAIMYGGAALAARYAGRGGLLFNGPGASAAYVDLERTDHSPETLARFLADCALHHAGRQCTALSGLVLQGGDPEPVLQALADALERVPRLADPLDPAARLAAFVDPRAGAAHRRWLEAASAEPGARCRTRPWVATPVLPPVLLQLNPDSPRFGTELSGPILTAIALPAGADPLPYLGRSLAVTLVDAADALADRLLAEPAVHKCFRGLTPTYTTEPGAPHHGLLSEFLFGSKAVGEGTTWN